MAATAGDAMMLKQPAPRQVSHASQNSEEWQSDPTNSAVITAKARDATEHEHEITTKHALRHYRKAIWWSFIVSMSIVMEAYDTLLISSFYAYPSFTERFGVKVEDGCQMEPKWQAALSNGETVGLFFGCLINGWLSDKFSRKLVIQGSYLFTGASLFMMFFAPNVEVLFGSVFIRGLPMGIFAIMGPTYACEVCPVILRSYLTGWVNICWVLGHIVGAALLRGLVDWHSEWSYRIPMAVQWVWVIPLFIITLWCPESPWWLVRHRRQEDAKKSLRALCSKQEQVNVDQTLAMMIHTYEFEEKQAETDGGWLNCFRGTNLRRTEVSIGGWGFQAVAGFAISGQSTYFFIQAGLKTGDAFWFTLGQYFVALAGNLLCYVLLHYFGRRPVYTWGYVGMFIIMFLIGCLGLAPSSNSDVAWGQGTLSHQHCKRDPCPASESQDHCTLSQRLLHHHYCQQRCYSLPAQPHCCESQRESCICSGWPLSNRHSLVLFQAA